MTILSLPRFLARVPAASAGRHAAGRPGLVPFRFRTDDNGRRLAPLGRHTYGTPVAVILGQLAAETQEVPR